MLCQVRYLSQLVNEEAPSSVNTGDELVEEEVDEVDEEIDEGVDHFDSDSEDSDARLDENGLEELTRAERQALENMNAQELDALANLSDADLESVMEKMVKSAVMRRLRKLCNASLNRIMTKPQDCQKYRRYRANLKPGRTDLPLDGRA